jgi:signal peptidase I
LRGQSNPEPAEPRLARRKPWIAAALTPCLAGLGHLYGGAPRRAVIAWCLGQVATVAILAITATLPPRIGAFAPWALLLLGEGVLMFDAARTARRASPAFRLQAYNRWYVYLALPFLSAFVIDRPLRPYIQQHIYDTFWIRSTAMAPTILIGDFIYATPVHGAVSRGDIVIYRDQGVPFIKRAVAIAGDTIAMQNDTLFVNGRLIIEPYAIPSRDTGYDAEFDQQRWHLAHPSDAERYRPTWATWGPLVVPSRTYFVLGDNRGKSRDSRSIGPLGIDSVTQRPIGVYFSRDPKSGTIRWNRIGRSVSR